MNEEPVILVNCTGRGIHVLVAGRRALLPAAPRPGFVDGAGKRTVMAVSVDDAVVSLEVHDGGVEHTIFVPDPAPGVRYLVPDEVLLRLSHRTDLVVPARFKLNRNGEGDDGTLLPAYLVAVRGRLAAAGADIPNLAADEFDDESEGER